MDTAKSAPTAKGLLSLLVIIEALPYILFFGIILGAAKEIADGFHRILRAVRRTPSA